MKIRSDRASLALGCEVIVDTFYVSDEVYNQIKIKSKSRYSLPVYRQVKYTWYAVEYNVVFLYIQFFFRSEFCS